MSSRPKPRASAKPKGRVFRIHLRPDGKYEGRSDIAGDSPLGVDRTLSLAIGSARREADLAARAGDLVTVQVLDAKGRWVDEYVARPTAR